MRKALLARPSKRIWLLSGLIVSAALLLLLIRLFVPSFFTVSKPSPSAINGYRGLDDFLKRYWQRPIYLQGPLPSNYSKLEASLSPEACGSCHSQQYADWKESLHSRAMGPGPWGQILDLTRNSPQEAVQCMTCHAPLSEQMPSIAQTTNGQAVAYAKNPYFDSQLQLEGITCAACHVRQHRRFGPPKAEGASATQYPAGTPNHGGVQRTPYFERAEFCKDCHQFDPEDSLLVNGKPLQDTYREWQSSSWGKGGTACQDCHMSNRRHLWKGIHDQEWVKGGVRFNVNLQRSQAQVKQKVFAIIEVTNAAVGHKFPTYITPKVFLRASLLDSKGKSLPGTLRQQTIGWDARFADGEWKEFFDTRISPGESLKERFEWVIPPKADKIRVWLEVHPDHFYHIHFYPAYLQRTDLSAEGRKLIERALEESGKTPYILYEQIYPLNKAPRSSAAKN